MTNKFVEIYDPKKRNQIVEEYPRLRKKLKNRDKEQQNTLRSNGHNRVELLKPITEAMHESNQKLQNEMIEDRNKIINTLKVLID